MTDLDYETYYVGYVVFVLVACAVVAGVVAWWVDR